MIIDIFNNGQILESVSGSAAAVAIESINNAKNFGAVKKYLESLDPNNGKADAEAKAAYGLRVRGQVARKKLNDAAKEIISRVKGDHTKLTAEDKDILMQYSGRGGLKDSEGADKGAQLFEYYTPPEIAEGTWDALKANGFENGAVLEPSAGAGVFIGTKPAGVKVVGAEIDETSSSVASLLNPDDQINNQSFEQLCMSSPDGSFDAVIGNVPFGDTRGSYSQQDEKYQDIKHIQRYFVTRSIDKVKPGGLLCLIVPVDIVSDKSKTYQKWRRQISLKAEFLGAHKLPSGTFGGANGNGTDTVTDILVMRRHSKDLAAKVVDMAASDLEAANVYWPTWMEGLWFKSPQGKKFIHGEVTKGFRGDIVKSSLTNAGIKKLLARKFKSRIDLELIGAALVIERAYIDGDRRTIAGIEHEMIAGNWVIVEQTATADGKIDKSVYGMGSVSEITDALKGSASALKLSFEQASKAAGGQFSTDTGRSVRLALAQAKKSPSDMQERIYRASLIGAEIEHYSVKLTNGEATEADLEQLQALIVNEVSTYGNPTSDMANMVFTGDGAARVISFAKAVKKDGAFNDLLAGKLDLASAETYNSNDLSDVVRFLTNSNGLPVELDSIQELYTGQAAIATLSDIAGISGIAITEDGLVNTITRYLAGDISNKISRLNQAIASQQYPPAVIGQFKTQLELIDKSRKKTDIDGITFGFRSKWFERKYVLEFLEETGYAGGLYLSDDGSTIRFGSADGLEKQLGKFINGEGVSAGVRTKEYKDRIAQLEKQFNTWMKQHEDTELLTESYNDIFNSHLPYEYDEAPLGLEGVSEQVKPHGYQNAAIRRASEEGRGIIALDTGLGKTFSALALATYNQQQGRAKRTCVVVPKAVLENWYHEANQFHGKLDHALVIGFTAQKNKKTGSIERAEVLDEEGKPKLNRHTGEKEYRDVLKADSAAMILDKMHEIPTTAATLIIMSKEQFGKIPLRPETREKYTDEMVGRRLLPESKAKNYLMGGAPEKGSSYQDAKQSERLRAMYSAEGSKKDGSYPYYEQMGFDSVIVDEAHEFKNAYEAGSQVAKLAYLPTAPASGRSIDMAAKMDYLRQKNAGRGPVLLSATPITNSPTEIFNMLSYVMDIEEFNRMGVQGVDDFIALYCDVQSAEVTKLSGATETKEAVVGFRNLDGLRSLFNRFTNVKTAEDVNDQNNSLSIPDANELTVSAEMNSDQKSIYEELRLLAEGKVIDEESGQVLTLPQEDRPAIFSVIRDMDRVTTDIDLYNRTMTFKFPISKKASVESLIADLPSEAKEKVGDSEEGEEVEEIKASFSEIKTNEEGKFFIVITPEVYEDEVVKRFKKFGIDSKEVSHPVTPKYSKMLENLRLEHERGGKQLIFTEEKSQHNKLKTLIVHNLPVTEDEIEIINGATANGDKLEKISASYNTGKSRIVIANKKAEVGVNLQKGTTAIHHLTFPWTPASIQQRNGRGVRQGNTASSVDVFYYAGKGSFDSYRLDMLKRKAGWLNNLFTGEETAVDNANAGDSDEYAALLASDPEDFKRRMNEQREAKAAKEREQRNIKAGIDLANLQSSKKALSGLDEREAKALEEAGTEEEKNNITGRFATLKEKHEKNVKRLTRDLVGQAKAGAIDVNAEQLVDNNNYLVDSSGTVFEVDAYYEAKSDKGSVIYYISKIDKDYKMMGGEVIHVDDYGSIYSLTNDLRSGSLLVAKAPLGSKRVAMTKQKAAQKRILSANSVTYSDLLSDKYACGSDFLAEMQRFINFKDGGFLFVTTPEGSYNLKQRLAAGEKIVYPEKDNSVFIDSFCKAALPIAINDQYSLSDTAKALLGDNWKEKILSYGRSADQDTVKSIVTSEITGPLISSILESSESPKEILSRLARSMYGIERTAKLKAVEKGYINVKDFSIMAESEIGAKHDEFKALVDKLKAEEDKAKEIELLAKAEADKLEEEKIKASLPKIPQELIDALNEMNIVIKINSKPIKWSSRNKGKQVLSDAGARLFMNDKDGKAGKLFPMSQSFLKSKYKAVWSAGFADGFDDLWWHFPVDGLNFDELLKEVKGL